MAFFGSTTKEMRDLFHEMVREDRLTRIYVGCSGGFGIERAVMGIPTVTEIHGCDVNIWTCAVGKYYSGQHLEFTINPDYPQLADIEYIKDYVGTRDDLFTTILLVSDLAKFLGKPGNAYYTRMLDAYRLQWPTLFEKMQANVKKFPLRLTSFYCGDVMDFIETVPEDDGVTFLSCPPYEGFSKAFENQFRHMERLFTWDKPSFKPLEKPTDLFDRILRMPSWGFSTNKRYPQYEDHLCGIIQMKRDTDSFYHYAKTTQKHAVSVHSDVKPFPVKPLDKDDSISDTIRLVPIEPAQFDLLRAQYLNKTITPASAMLYLAVIAGDRLVGGFALSPPNAFTDYSSKAPGPFVYAMSDFCVPSSKYRRLSKLILYAMLSNETQLLAERMTRKRARTLITTAFTDKPISMKYRGLFDQLSRKDNPHQGGKRWMINYGARMGQWTLADGMTEWQAKHGTVIT